MISWDFLVGVSELEGRFNIVVLIFVKMVSVLEVKVMVFFEEIK